VITVTILAGTLSTTIWLRNLGYVSLALYLSSGVMYTLYFTVLRPDKKNNLPSTSLNPRFKLTEDKLQVNEMEQFCHVSEKAMKINGERVYSSADYNYRLQVLDPCFDCMLGRKHEDKDENDGQTKCCSPTRLLRRLKHFLNRPFGGYHHERLTSNSVTDIEKPAYQREELKFLMNKVNNYDVIHSHLLYYFPGVEDICYANREIISRCRGIGPHVFRSIKAISEDELKTNLATTGNRLKVKIQELHEDMADSQTLDDTLFEQFKTLCNEFFNLKQQEWENKVLEWCKTAPTQILSQYNRKNWGSSEFMKDLEKWILEKEKLAVLNSYNRGNLINDTQIVLHDDKHSKFYINGKKVPDNVKQGWVSEKWKKITNCVHGNSGNSSSPEVKYQRVPEELCETTAV
jgi:hypothetical protein